MRIFSTGIWEIQTGASWWTLGKPDGTKRPMLTEFNTEVEDYRVELGVSIDHLEPEAVRLEYYDLGMVGIFNGKNHFTSWRRPKVYQLLWELYLQGFPHFAYIWDANVRQIVDYFLEPAKDDRLLRRLCERSGADYDRARKGADMLLGGKWPPMVVCMFPWGDLDYVSRLAGVRCNRLIDPTCFVDTYGQKVAPVKQRRWTFATTKEDAARWWGNLEWPLDEYGPRTRRVPERVVVKSYGQNWGVLHHTYPHSGMGWWRPRFGFVSQMGAISSCPYELDRLGPMWRYSPQDIEALSTAELECLHGQQYDSFWSAVWSKDQYIREVQRLFKDTIDNSL